MRIGTRKSALAVTQTEWVAAQLRAAGLTPEIIFIESAGDKDHTRPLYEMENHGPGLFTKQLEDALLSKRIDLAVHSLKDFPTRQPSELQLVAVTAREDVSDSILIHPAAADSALMLGVKKGARVGTSSLRREALLKEARPDLVLVPLRGNVPTRLEKARSGALDAVILASAGLDRLKAPCEGLIRTRLPQEKFVPAPGQGALGLECRKDLDSKSLAACATLNDPAARLETRVEREILQILEGGCTLPLGVRCWANLKGLHTVSAFLGIASLVDKTRTWTDFKHFTASDTDADALVQRVVAHFKAGQS